MMGQKLVHLSAQVEKGYKAKQSQWEAAFNWYLEASKRKTETFASLQAVSFQKF